MVCWLVMSVWSWANAFSNDELDNGGDACHKGSKILSTSAWAQASSVERVIGDRAC